MKRRTIIKQMGMALSAAAITDLSRAAGLTFSAVEREKIINGPFKPTWESLQAYKVPDWFRNAKFGIWAHWGPQCQPEAGDWYAREMYEEGSYKYNFHLKKYGHPSKFGFKDVINEWKADKWDPEELVALYKNAGAKYFFAMANHHDNLDLYRSKYQKNWNSLKVGPKKDIIGGWAKAAKNNGLPFGCSVHAAHAWRWFETAQRHDKKGEYAGIPYDGNITRKNGKGKWWEGLDPQELYAQNHPLSKDSWDNGSIHRQWHWGEGVYPPSKEYIEKFVNRTIDLINKYEPDLLYFDDSQLPFWPISDAGLRIAAHHYNKSIKKHGELRAILNGKILNEEQRKAMVWDIERGQASNIMPYVWQTDTCLGSWHYERLVYEKNRYKTPEMVIQTLVDVVSKNGNYLLNVPVRGDGSIDELERKIVADITAWMKVNSESIYDTRPWNVYGEGPSTENQAALMGQGFNEGKTRFSSVDIRFNSKPQALYATIMKWPEERTVLIRSLAAGSSLYPKEINGVSWLESGADLKFERRTDGLLVTLPNNRPQFTYANVLKIV
ncbi:alpha-L-fucosidase [Niabella sp. CJ426]|uniref:alpha-L-fucosidase n=1 Tax=Niabella sp. CJ426 TaxID=3393740 RepID=UPI003D013BDB